MIEFEFENQEKTPVIFGSVPINQFFIPYSGELMQKISGSEAQIVAAANGIPYSENSKGWTTDIEISRILPNVTKIKF